MELTVTTKSGKIRGFRDQNLIKFLGIPFAEKPIGELRFRRAVPVHPWEGVLTADHFGDSAVQMGPEGAVGSEDCLTLNVVRPAEDSDRKLPVYVWIHGGGYMTGSANDRMYDGTAFASEGIVYVSIQYRLNVLGFFDFCTYPGCEGFETNRGLSDMVTALRWIHENIGAFGGDPDQITIGGESAGGAAVVTLMAVPAVKGCFRQVIAESALCNCVMTPQTSRENMDLYLEGMGLTASEAVKLKEIPADELLRGLDRVSAEHQYKNPGMFLPGPVIDDLLPRRPLDAIRDGSAEGVRLLIGSNLHEGTMFVHPEKTGFPNSWDMIHRMFEKNGNLAGYDRIHEYYTRKDFDRDYGTEFVHFATDYAFEMPSIKAAEYQREHGAAYVFRFELLSRNAVENGMLVSHAFELPCVFAVENHPFSQLFFGGETMETCRRIIQDMHDPWVRFIKTGEPDPENWPEFAGYRGPVRVFDRQTRTEEMDRTELMEVWDDMRFYEN